MLRMPSTRGRRLLKNNIVAYPRLTPQGGRHAEHACYHVRRGAAMVMILTALALATMIFLAAAKLTIVQRRTIELSARQVQAEWLAESGVQRAAARLAADPKYRGETWNIAAEEFGGRDGGMVTIRVEDVPGKSDRRTLHVEADYPPDPEQRARQTRDVLVKVSGARPAGDAQGSLP
jgi:type II secretory pathway component PulK